MTNIVVVLMNDASCSGFVGMGVILAVWQACIARLPAAEYLQWIGKTDY